MTTRRKLDVSAIRDLVALVELERSSLRCVQLARALGYHVSGKPGDPLFGVYFSLDVLIEDMVRDARRLVGRC